jgi:uncharacterized protein YecE (DUF72 family)
MTICTTDSLLPRNFYSGLSGLSLPIPKYLFPEAFQNSSRLTYYASLFNSIEINSTFYRLPKIQTVSKWMTEVPDDFRFTFKLWKEITHVPDLFFKESDVHAFFNVVSAAAEKKGCILVQFPPKLTRASFAQLDLLLACIKKNNPAGEWKIAAEFRNKSWYVSEVYQLLNLYGTALVVHDIPKSHTPLIDHLSDFMYIRFHGPTGNYRDSYAQHFLEEYATYIREWLHEQKTVYVYFNNTAGDAYRNLETMNRLICQATL